MINVIADRYAQALFEVGEETQTTSELYQELSELVKILNENNDFYSFLKSPLISCEDKKTVMQNIFENQLSDSMNNFLKIVIDKDRMSVIEKIKESYKSLLNDKNNVLEVIKGYYEKTERYKALDCIECGSCSFICPARRPLLQSIRNAKREIISSKKN